MSVGKTRGTTEGSAAPIPERPVATPFPFGFLVHDVSRIRRTLMDHHLRPLGITRSQWTVMSALSREGETGMMQNDLARHLGIGKVSLAGLVGRLETSGHIERISDPMDRRVKRVFITEQGYQMFEQIVAVVTFLNARILDNVDADELAAAEKVLGKVRDNMRAQLALIPVLPI